MEEVEEILKDEEKKKKPKDKFEDRIPGCLSVLSLSSAERECLLDYLAASQPLAYSDYIFSLMGEKKFLAFFDVLEGLTIKIPSRQVMVKTINYVKIYSYLQSRNFTSDAYDKASKLYKKRVVSLKRIVNKVEEILAKKGEVTEIEE